ncbi:MAG: TonB family protein [Gammaproteobacteria bacterium]|nr:TonB family protein [Gammaproteobacteria bacterium]
MLTGIIKRLPATGFWLSLLLHLMILFSFILTLHFQSPPSIKPDSYVKSYVYHEEAAPASKAVSKPQKELAQKDKPVSEMGIEKPSSAAAAPSIPSMKQLKAMALSKERTAVQDDVELIGDKKIDAPLLKLLGKSLSAHLTYPKPAIDFNVRGIVRVGFLIYPDGHITDIQLVGSSNAGVLDQASLLAVNAMSPVAKVNTYLDKPKYLVVGIIFG